MKLSILLLMIFVSISHGSSDVEEERITKEISSKLANCELNTKEDFERCLKLMAESIRPHAVRGIRRWNIPPMEPLRIESIQATHGSGKSSIKANFKSVEINGLSNYVVTAIRSDPKAMKFDMDLSFNEMNLKGTYEINGQLLSIPLSGNGPFIIQLSSITATGKSIMTKQEDKLSLQSVKCDFNIKGMKINLSNLFNGDKVLGEATNKVLNENADAILKDIKPKIKSELDTVILQAFRKAFLQIPTEKLIKTFHL